MSIWPLVLVAFTPACSDLQRTEGDWTASELTTGLEASDEEVEPAAMPEEAAPEGSGLLSGLSPARGLGRMTARVPGTSEIVGGVRLESHHVRVTIRDGIAHTEIEESFFNESSRVLEGRLVLPIPSDAILSRLALYVDGKLVEGEVVARNRADRIFRGIVDDTVRPRDPALLDAVGGGALSLRIFPIPAGKARSVVFAYDHILRRDASGRVSVRVPLSFGDAPTQIDHVTVTIDGTTLLDERRPATLDDVALALDEDPPNVLVASGVTQDIALVRATAEGVGDERRFEGAVAVVLDVSSAQTDASLALQKHLAKAVIDDLGPEESFVVLACDAACESFPRLTMPPWGALAVTSPDVVADAQTFLDGLSPRGAYDLGGALMAANARLEGPRAKGVEGQVLLLSNGASTSGVLSTEEVITTARDALSDHDVRLIGVGRSVDAPKLSALAVALGATYDPLGTSAVEIRNQATLRRAPVSRGPTFDLPSGFDGADVSHVLPTRIGEEFVVLARGHANSLWGRRSRENSNEKVVPEAAAAAEGNSTDAGDSADAAESMRSTQAPLARFWANERIAFLEASRVRNVKEIVSLATEHHLLSSETSLLVLENDAMFAQYAVPQTPPVEDWTSSSTVGIRAPQIRYCMCSVSGRLPPEAIQRIVRQNAGRMRACYTTALARNPGLSGRISTAFVIGRSGEVTSVRNASSEIADEKLVDCVTKAFAPLSFPPPEGGNVHVEYPISFTTNQGAREEPAPVEMKIPRVSRMGFSLGDPWPKNSASRPPPPRPAPEQQPTVSHRRGDDAWLEPGLHERAISSLEARLARREHSRPARRGLIRDALLRGQIERAAAHAATWVELDPDNPQAHEVYAETLVATGEPTEAAMQLSAAAALDPHNEERQFAAAFTWEVLHDRERHCSHVRALADLNAEYATHATNCGPEYASALVRTRGFDIETAMSASKAATQAVVISPDGRVISELLTGHAGLMSGTYRTVLAGDRGELRGTLTVRALGVEFTVEVGDQERSTSVISEVWIPRYRRPVVRSSGAIL